MKVLKTRLENYNDRKDGTVSVKLDSLLEVKDSDIAEIRGLRGNIAIVAITDVVDVLMADVKVSDILELMPDDPFKDTKLTPSQQQRRDLYVIQKMKLGRKPTKEEQAQFYIERMQSIHERNLEEMRELEGTEDSEDKHGII